MAYVDGDKCVGAFRQAQEAAMISETEAGFYWVKHQAGSRWEPVEFDGSAWLIGDGTGKDLYLISPRIWEPSH